MERKLRKESERIILSCLEEPPSLCSETWMKAMQTGGEHAPSREPRVNPKEEEVHWPSHLSREGFQMGFPHRKPVGHSLHKSLVSGAAGSKTKKWSLSCWGEFVSQFIRKSLSGGSGC